MRFARLLSLSVLAAGCGEDAPTQACVDAGSACEQGEGPSAPPPAPPEELDEPVRWVEQALAAPAWSEQLHEAACPPEAALAPASDRGRFVDVSEHAGIGGPLRDPCAEDYAECHATSMTGGVATGDFDADGYPDLYVTHVRARDQLFLNCRDGRFVDVTDALGLSKADGASNGAVFFDADSDGDLDLLVTTYGVHATRHYLYLMEEGLYREDGINRGVAMWNEGPLYGTSVAVGDYDNDGYVDLFLGEWRQDLLVPEGAPSQNHARLLRNRAAERPGFFEDVTREAGLVLGGTTSNGIATLHGVFIFTPIFADMDADGYLDLSLTADYGSSRLFWNQRDGTFQDGSERAKIGTEQTGMGAFVADYDGDGLQDLFVTAIYEAARGYNGNRLFRNLGGRTFEDRTDAVGVRDVGWGWGAAPYDHDLDGDLDIIAVGGFTNNEGARREYPGVVRLWQQPDDAGAPWPDVAGERLPSIAGQGRAVALLDFDLDGDQDLFVASHGAPDSLLRNDLAERRYLRIKVQGRTNTHGIGVRITASAGGARQLRELQAGTGYLSQSENVVQFGFGSHEGAVDLEILWPAQARLQRARAVPTNRTLTIIEP